MRRLVLLGFLLFVCSSALAGEPQWVEVRSPHFSVVSDAGEKRAREVAIRFEQMRAVFGALLTKANVNLPIPLQIVAFRNGKEMRQFLPLWHGKPTKDAGLFFGGDDRSFILLDLSTDYAWQTVFHEYGHQLLHGNTSGELSPWFDEGFAEYFSTIKVAGKEANVGDVSQIDFDTLQLAPWLHVADLLRVRQDSNVYNESGDRRSAFYAQSWLMVHYLYDKQLLLKAAEYFTLVYDKNVPTEQATLQAFGMTTADWDKTLRQYFSRNQFLYFKIPTPPGIETTGYTVAPLAPADSKAILADLHVHSSDYADQSIAEFEEVLKLQPNHPAALRGLGYAYLRKRDFAHAAEYFDKAAALDTHDPRVLYYSAMLMNQENRAKTDEELKRTQSLLERAVQLDPNFADAYNLLAFADAALGKREDGLAAMKKALSLNPGNVGYYYNLAEMYLANQDMDSAIKLFENLKNSSNPEIAARAQQELARVEAYKEVSSRTQTVSMPHVVSRDSGTDNNAVSTIEVETASPPAPALGGTTDFLKGKLVSVDCSATPGATLTITTPKGSWSFHTANAGKLVVIGSDKLDCAWSNRSVAVNYRSTGTRTGELVSLELQ